MRIREIVCEKIETGALYHRVYPLVLNAFKTVAVAVSGRYQEGQYWAGDVMDALNAVFDPILHETFDGRSRHRVFFRVKQVPGETVGGNLHDPGNGNLILDLHLPKSWVSGSPSLFFYLVRDNGERWAAELTAAFLHEIVHVEQTIRAVANLSGSTSADPVVYLSHDREIEAQALSAALELIRWLGDARQAMAWLKTASTKELGRAGDMVAPHLGQYWSHIRPVKPVIWRRFLKALVWQLHHYSAAGS